jgi:hypothetical protein
MVGFIGTSVTVSLNHPYYNAVANLHSLQLLNTNLLSLLPLVFTIRFLATDL